MVEHRISVKILITTFFIAILISCKLNSNNEKKITESNVEYDGYIELNSLSPEYFKGKYYLDLRISVESSNRLTLNEKKIELKTLSNEINNEWEVIEKDNYKAFLNLSIGNSKDADFGFYLTVYKLIENFKINKKNEYSKNRFGKEYLKLSGVNKEEVDKKILINIVESEPEIDGEKK